MCAAGAGHFPALEKMAFNRVIPSQHLMPAQVESVALREIRPPYNSEMGSEIGTFYLVRAWHTHWGRTGQIFTRGLLKITILLWRCHVPILGAK